MKAAETKEILHHLLDDRPGVKTVSVHIVRKYANGQTCLEFIAVTWQTRRMWLSLCLDIYFLWVERRMHLQLSRNFSVLAKPPQTQTDSPSSVCCPVRVMSWHSFKLVKDLLGTAEWSQHRLVSRVGATENTSAVLPSPSCVFTPPLVPATHGHSAHQRLLHCTDFTPLC